MSKKIISIPSTNFDERPDGARIKYLIFHYTEVDLDYSLELLTQPCPKKPVSSHYLICEAGDIYHLVEEANRAWHAGMSAWEDDVNLNATSLGIELVNPGHGPNYRPFTKPQLRSLLELSQELMKTYDISPFHVLAHSDIAPLRKLDPGELLDWRFLAEEGVGVYPPRLESGDHLSPQELQEKLRNYGYAIEVTGELDEQTRKVINVFKMHFGGEDLSDVSARLDWLLQQKRSRKP